MKNRVSLDELTLLCTSGRQFNDGVVTAQEYKQASLVEVAAQIKGIADFGRAVFTGIM
ncbi:hypothetical protein D3C85_1714060 [compost metagenome]